MTATLNPVLRLYPNPLSNVFLMMRFQSTAQHVEIAKAISYVLAAYSMNLIRADTTDYLPQLWDNVEACIGACRYGIAVLEQIDQHDINPNVSLELGYMWGQGKQCLLLKGGRLPFLPSDLSGHLYSEFDEYAITDTVVTQVRRWLGGIGIAKKPNERQLVFLSASGTCRAAMATAITDHLLETNPPGYPLRILPAAMYEPSLPSASDRARAAIRQMYGQDPLANHRAVRLNDTIVAESDLILVMDHALYSVLEKTGRTTDNKKIQVFKPYFGLQGDVADPWPYHDTAEAACRYAETAEELRSILEPNLGKFVSSLNPYSALR